MGLSISMEFFTDCMGHLRGMDGVTLFSILLLSDRIGLRWRMTDAYCSQQNFLLQLTNFDIQIGLI
jgi:hypothetical protein